MMAIIPTLLPLLLWPMLVIPAARGAQALSLRIAGQDIVIKPWGRDSLRVTAVPAGHRMPDDLGALLPLSQHIRPLSPPSPYESNQQAQQHGRRLANGNIEAIVDGASGSLTVRRVHDGQVLLRETAPRSFSPSRFSGRGSADQLFEMHASFGAAQDEQFYGMGQHKHGSLDNRGRPVALYPGAFIPVNTEVFIPVVVSSLGYAYLFNYPGLGRFSWGATRTPPACPHYCCADACHSRCGECGVDSCACNNCPPECADYFAAQNDPASGGCSCGPGANTETPPSNVTWIANAAKKFDLWVTTSAAPAAAASGGSGSGSSGGSSSSSSSSSRVSHGRPWAAQLMHNYVDATGHSPVFPEWATGLWQSKNRYTNQSEVMGVVEGYKRRGLPLPSVVVIDFFSWAPTYVAGDYLFDPHCWPDPRQMVEDLRAEGVEVMVSTYHLRDTSIRTGTLD
jgi:alpha-glucosidase (family GH31 glycosyl hydrolase)